MSEAASSPGANGAATSPLPRLLATLGILMALAVAVIRLQPPTTVSRAADASDFSGQRAMDFLSEVLDDEAPHPVGSLAADQVRARLLSTLEDLGADVRVIPSFACTSNGRRCAHLHNIVATLGVPSKDRPAALIATHYDSVPAGPGAGDDGVGVAATLELLRAWRSRGTPWPLVALFDEGEEVGLLGARAFIEDPASLEHIGVVFNLEARGTGGRVSMFETKGDATLWVLRYGEVVDDMVANSLSAEVYRRMPNDTDLTVFGATDLPGLNFAMIDGVARYHTDRDDLAHLDPRSVQHMGDQVLALLASIPSRGWPGRDAAVEPQVYMDVLGTWFVRWPEAWTPWICSLVALLAWAGFVRSSRASTHDVVHATRRAIWILGRVMVAPALAFSMAWAMHWVACWHLDTSAPGYASGAPLRFGIVLCSLLAWWWCTSVPAPQAKLPREAGFALSSTIAAALGWLVPGAALPFLAAPVVAVGLRLVPWIHDPSRPTLHACAAALPGMVAIVVMVPLFHAVDLAFGPSPAPALAVLACLILWACPTPALPATRSMSMRKRLVAPLLLVALVSLWTLQAPVFDDDSPQPLSLVRVKRVATGEASTAMIAWGGWGARAALPSAVDEGRGWRPRADPAPDTEELVKRLHSGTWHHRAVRPSTTPPPRLSSEHRDDHTTLLTVQSRRGAHTLGVELLDPGAAILEVDGYPIASKPRSLTLFGARDGAASILVRRVGATLECTIEDVVSGAHPLDAARISARPSWASPRQWGDRHVVYEVHTLRATAR